MSSIFATRESAQLRLTKQQKRDALSRINQMERAFDERLAEVSGEQDAKTK